jgi:hypothetical protein
MRIALATRMHPRSRRCTIVYTVALDTLRIAATSRTVSHWSCCSSQVAVGPGSPDPSSKLTVKIFVFGGARWDGWTTRDPDPEWLRQVAKRCNRPLTSSAHFGTKGPRGRMFNTVLPYRTARREAPLATGGRRIGDRPERSLCYASQAPHTSSGGADTRERLL